MTRRPWQIAGLTLAAVSLSAAALAAWSPSDLRPSVERPHGLNCQFAIRASNDLDHDVYVYLYNSHVKNMENLFRMKYQQMKIQNHRIAPGKSMDRRYDANGSCDVARDWSFRVKRRGEFCIAKFSSKTQSDPRTINLGRASQWSASTCRP